QLAAQALEHDAEAVGAHRDDVRRLGDEGSVIEILAALDAVEDPTTAAVGERAEPVDDAGADRLVLRPRRDAAERIAACDVNPDAGGPGEDGLAPRPALRPIHQDVIDVVVARAEALRENTPDDLATHGPEGALAEQALLREPPVDADGVRGLGAEAVIREHD